MPEDFALCIQVGIGGSIDDSQHPLQQFRCLISTGFAAGLRSPLAAGALLLPEKVRASNGDWYDANAEWHANLAAAIPATSTDPIVCTENIVETPHEKLALGHAGEYAGADMESALLAAVCYRNRVPFAALRIILDPADVIVPRAITRIGERGTQPRVASLLVELARRPQDLGRLIAFARCTVTASRSLVDTVADTMAELSRREGE